MKATETTPATLHRSEFSDASKLATALAQKVAGRLSAGIVQRGQAVLVVSGGSTPKRFFAELSKQPIAWDKVTVTLADERMVGPDHERSNHRLASEHLLQNHAASAQFLPLYGEHLNTDDAARAAAQRIDALGSPFDVVVLGMGTDGHTASFFPGGSTLEMVLDPGCTQSVMAIEAPGADEPRLTLTLPKTLEAEMIVLHMEGEAKAAVLARALQPGPVAEMPVRAVLRGARHPLEIFWAP